MTFWYSTKEYKPSDSGQYLVHQGSSGYCFIADVDHMNDGTFHFHNSENDDYISDITHFASIPPIPFVNENELLCQPTGVVEMILMQQLQQQQQGL